MIESDQISRDDEILTTLRSRKTEALDALLQKRPGEKRYKRTLKDFLEADAALEAAVARRLGNRR